MRCFLLIVLLSVAMRLVGQLPVHTLCGTPDALPAHVQQAMRSTGGAVSRSAESREIRLAFDVRQTVLQRLGGDAEQVRWLIYQRVAALSEQFAHDINVRVSVSYIHFWDKPDGYDVQSIFTALRDCRAYWRQSMGQIARDAVVLYDDALPGAAGYAYSFTTCDVEQSYLAVNSLQTPARAYDNLLAHELGHLLGVPHTHSCSWPNGPLDSCYQVEGPCANTTFLSVQRVGYLMSYCSLEGRSFHPQAKSLIGRLAGQACWAYIADRPLAPTLSHPTPQEVLAGQSAYLRVTPPVGASMYHWEWSTDSLFQQQTTTSSGNVPMQALYQLQSGRRYYWRVQASNEFGRSAWSAVGSFLTGRSAAQTTPTALTPRANATDTYPTFRFRSVAGALAYRVRCYNAQGGILWQEITSDTTVTAPLITVGVQEQMWSVSVFTLTDGSLVNGPEALWQGFLTPARTAPSFPSTEVANAPFATLLRTAATTDSVCYTVQWSATTSFNPLAAEKKGMIRPEAFVGLSWLAEKWYSVPSPSLPKGLYYGRVQQGACSQVNKTWTTFGPVQVHQEAQYTVFHHGNSPLPPGQVHEVAVHPLTQEKWLATSEGVLRTPDGSHWTAYTLQSTQGQIPQRVASLAFDRAGHVWTANFQYGISRFDGQRWVLFPLGFDVPENLRGHIQYIAPDDNGGVYFSWGPTQVWYYHPVSRTLRLVLDGATEEHGTVLSLQRDADGVLWMTFTKGIWIYNGQSTQRSGPPAAVWQRTQAQGKPCILGKTPGAGLAWASRAGILLYEKNVWTDVAAPTGSDFQSIVYSDSTLWLVGDGQWMRYHVGRKQWTVLPPFGPSTTAAIDAVGFLWAANQPSATVYRVQMTGLRTTQSIDLSAPSILVLGETTPKVVASASSGLPVALTVTAGNATLSASGILTAHTLGKISLQATQIGDDRYLPAPPIEKNLCVVPARPTVRRDSVQGNILYSSSTQNNQWYWNGSPIVGATQPILRTTAEGYYAVLVTNKDGCPSSAPSPTMEVRFNMAQTLRFVSISTKTVGDAPFEAMITTNSGLPVTLSVVSGPAFLLGERTLRLMGAGKVVLRAQQEGNWQYLPATITYEFCVIPATPVIGQDLAVPRFLRSNALTGNQWLLNDTVLRNATGPTLWANDDGRYSLVVVNTGGCPSSKPAIPVVVAKTQQTIDLPLVAPVVAPTTVTLRASASSGLPITYLVTNGAVQQRDNQLEVLAAGRIGFKAIQAGNDSYQYAEAIGSFCALPPTPSIRRDTAQMRLLYASTPAASEWSHNDTLIHSVQTPYLMADRAGWYQVRTLNTDGCPPSAWSPAMWVGGNAQERSTDVTDLSSGIRLSPNPVQNLLTVRSPAAIVHLSIWDGQGQLVHRVHFATPEQVVQCAVATLPAGIYQCRVTGTDGLVRQMAFVKTHTH